MNVNLHVKDSRWQESLKWVTDKCLSNLANMLQIEREQKLLFPHTIQECVYSSWHQQCSQCLMRVFCPPILPKRKAAFVYPTKFLPLHFVKDKPLKAIKDGYPTLSTLALVDGKCL